MVGAWLVKGSQNYDCIDDDEQKQEKILPKNFRSSGSYKFYTEIVINSSEIYSKCSWVDDEMWKKILGALRVFLS